MRYLALAVAFAAGALSLSCNVNDYCLNCGVLDATTDGMVDAKTARVLKLLVDEPHSRQHRISAD